MKQWTVPAVVTVRTTVIVEAETEEDARVSFESGNWIDDYVSADSERVDWRATGKLKLEYEDGR